MRPFLLLALFLCVFGAAWAEDEASRLMREAQRLYGVGRWAEALAAAEKSLQLTEKKYGPDDLDTATSMKVVAELRRMMGDFAGAEPLYKRALAIRESRLGRDHPDIGPVLNGLGLLYYYMADFPRARVYYQRALAIYEKAHGGSDVASAAVLHNLGEVYRHADDYARAESYHKRALEIYERVLGPEHADTASSLEKLGALYLTAGDFARAEALYLRSLRIWERAGSEHPMVAKVLQSLAGVYAAMRDHAQALPRLQRAVEILTRTLGPDHFATCEALSDLARLHRDMGDYERSESLYHRVLEAVEKSRGPEHPQVATTLNRLALLYQAQGRYGEAEPLLVRALQIMERTKRSDDSIAEAQAARDELLQLLIGTPKDLSAEARQRRQARRAELERLVEAEEADLARLVAGLGRARASLQVTTRQVQAVLPDDAVLIEMVCYWHYLSPARRERRYGAVLIAPRSGPRWVALESAASIDELVRKYHQTLAQGTTTAERDKRFQAVLRELHEAVWAPLEEVFPAGTRTVILSPDGQLSFVSFATLLKREVRFVGQHYLLRYVASGRDLLREVAPPRNRRMALYGDPDYEAGALAATEHGSLTLRERDVRELRALNLTRLDGTARECEDLKRLATGFGWQAETHTGSAASEQALRVETAPFVLHLATHGFFLSEDQAGFGDPAGDEHGAAVQLKNPMLRSGLTLAGAQTTVGAWKRGEIPPPPADGVLMAAEVGSLDLRGTWLVVLSACETGRGELSTGEGVLGLRRGFVQAGAQHLLMTLWKVSDDFTPRLMRDFYVEAARSSDAPDALAQVQRRWLVELRQERGLVAAVRLAGAFIMTSSGAPRTPGARPRE